MTAPASRHGLDTKPFENATGHELISRAEFLQDLARAIERRDAYAAGGYGYSELHWMYYPLFLGTKPTRIPRKIYELAMTKHAVEESGIFPGEAGFIYKFNEFYINQVRQLDSVGVMALPTMEAETLRYYQFPGKWIYHLELFPDKSIPDNPNNCFLPALRGKRLLIVCPFADFLRRRATKEIFEGVWSKTGKRWFDPLAVEAVEFPYGIVAETRERYENALALLEEITNEITRRAFDVALIAAAGLAIPIAAYIKRMGKVAIDLGGPLQLIFGVKGKRWNIRPNWRDKYYNEWWVDLPDSYRPDAALAAADYGYW